MSHFSIPTHLHLSFPNPILYQMKFVDGVVNKFWKEAHEMCIVSRNFTILVRNMSFIGDKSKRIPGSAGAEDVCWDKQGHRRVVYTQTQSTWLHKYKYTNTQMQIHKYTNAQMHKYTYMYMGTDKDTGVLSELKHNVQCKIHSNAQYLHILTVYITFFWSMLAMHNTLSQYIDCLYHFFWSMLAMFNYERIQ